MRKLSLWKQLQSLSSKIRGSLRINLEFKQIHLHNFEDLIQFFFGTKIFLNEVF